MILNKVLEKIAKENGVPEHQKPRPCDVFDTIAGIGAGGWLAILLGRFRMDITSCLSEWYNLMQCIAPNSTTEEVRLRLLQHCYYDTERLVEQVEVLTQFYEIGDQLFEPDTKVARTRHVFVAALASDATSYNLFRSYGIPKSAKSPEKLLEGPKNPSSFKISRAFGVTGAARYFTKNWKEEMASSGKISFSDTMFPNPHNITGLALDEIWGIYGTDVPVSVVVNIGPGLPNGVDVERIARRFSWGSKPVPAHEAISTDRVRLPTILISQSNNMEQDIKRLSVPHHEETAEHNPTVEPVAEDECTRSVPEINTFRSIKARGIDATLRKLEDDIESDIKEKLNSIHPGNAEIYYRLAPAQATQGTSQDDSSASRVASDAILRYLSEPRVEAAIGGIAKRILKVVSNC